MHRPAPMPACLGGSWVNLGLLTQQVSLRSDRQHFVVGVSCWHACSTSRSPTRWCSPWSASQA